MKEKIWEEMTLEEKRELMRWILDETEKLRIRLEKLEDDMVKGGDCYE